VFDLREIASIVAGRLLDEQAADRQPQRAIHDSRRVDPGDLFVALTGTRVDGHAFLAEAFARGAVGALVAEGVDIPGCFSGCIAVPNTLAALQILAQAWATKLPARRVAITGSNGKTTTRALLAHLLGGDPRAYEAPKNYNTELGLPLAILSMPSEARIGVFELGADRPGDIGRLVDILQPDVGIITSAGPSHLDRFGSIDAVAREKWSLGERLPADGLLVLNADCAPLRERLEAEPPACQVVRVGFEHSDSQGELQRAVPRVDLLVNSPSMRLSCPVLGRHNATNLLLAATAAVELGVDPQTIEQRAATFSPIPHRLQPVPASFGTMLDDTYNANPASTEAALRVLAGYGPPSVNRLFVFGDMLDLAAISEREHVRIAVLALELGIDCILPAGQRATRACQAIGGEHFRIVGRHGLVDAILETAGREAVVLVKGSRALGLETLISELRSVTG